jgi:hypothetical protein
MCFSYEISFSENSLLRTYTKHSHESTINNKAG